MVSIHRKTHR